MRIVLTNDDGIFAPGLAAIYKQLVKVGSVSVVAPIESWSGSSHSVSFHNAVACTKVDVNGLFSGFSVQGSPADCVKLASMQLHEGPIDLVVAGINNGANAGINVYYSGTVAAAMEAAFLRIPSVAMSLSFDEKMEFDRAAGYCIEILRKMLPLSAGDVININIPMLSLGPPKGIRVVPQSTSGLHEYYVVQKTGSGEETFQLAGGKYRDDEEPTDTTSLDEGFITITALAPDMTDHKKTDRLRSRFQDPAVLPD